MNRKNVEEYVVFPKGDFVVVVGELAPSKSATGVLVLHAKGVDEPLSKGTVVATGPDTQKVKVGERVLFQWNLAAPMELFSRDVIHNEGPLKYLMKEVDILASLEPNTKKLDPTATNAALQGLKGDEAKVVRDEKMASGAIRSKLKLSGSN